ncbi:hypothetical protein [Sulfurimonas sp. CS5]
MSLSYLLSPDAPKPALDPFELDLDLELSCTDATSRFLLFRVRVSTGL